MRSTCLVLAVVLSVMVAAPRLSAQGHVASPQALDDALQQHVNAADQDRETVRQFLLRSDVRAIAGKYGIDIHRADRASTTLSDAEVASIAAQVRQAEPRVGGASSVTISTTTIIIGLLVLILLIVALR